MAIILFSVHIFLQVEDLVVEWKPDALGSLEISELTSGISTR